MDGKDSRADRFFRKTNVASLDVPNWKAIRDANNERRNQITTKLRMARLARGSRH
jgi:hypothetical protein